MIEEGSGIRLQRFIIAFSSNLLKKNGQQKGKCLLVFFISSAQGYALYNFQANNSFTHYITEQTNKEIPDPASGLKLTWSSAMLLFKSNTWNMQKPEDQWSCIAHQSAEDMLKSAVNEEKNFKHSPWAGADNPLGPNILMSTGRPHHYGHLLQVYKESLQPLTLYTSFHDLINVY